LGTFSHLRKRSHFFHTAVSLIPLQPPQIFSQAETAKLFRSDGSAMGAAEKYPSFD
jgi:hypothetical protein